MNTNQAVYDCQTLHNRFRNTTTRSTGLALQADSASAAKELAYIPDDILDAEVAAFRDRMIRRFGPDRVTPTDFGIEDSMDESV